MEIYIDSTNLILGRLASYVAKRALLGDTIKIFNCEDTVMTGDKYSIMARYRHKQNLTHRSGPYYPKMADRFVRRTIRGMLPYKQTKGSDAFKRIMCYLGVPEEFKDKELKGVAGANVIEKKVAKYMKISDLCKQMGGKQ